MSRTGIIVRAAICTGALLVIACGGGGSEPTDPGGLTPVASVSVTPSSAVIAPQQTQQLSASVKDAQGNSLSGRSVSWSTSASDKATVSGSGLVTGVAAGTATITATSEGKSGSAQVTIVAPVASVEVAAPSTTLVPQQAVQLTATPRDAGGAALTGRSVTWSSSQQQVATVSASGLVTALATGTTTITATSEGIDGTLALTVAAGSLVGSTGGTVSSGDGGLEITIPPGALTTATPISVTTTGSPASSPPASVQFNGMSYVIGPPGVTFAQPVTIKVKYDPATLPKWVMTGDLGVFLSGGAGWTELSDASVDVNAGTVSGTTTTIGASSGGRGGRGGGAASIVLADGNGPNVTAGVNYASVSLTPGSGSVNFQQRSVAFHAGLVPTGTGIPLSASGLTQGQPLWKIRWRTTGQNGSLGTGGTSTGWGTSMDAQYIATNAVLDQLSGPIDQVFVDVLLNPSEENNPAAQIIVMRQATVDADLQVTYDLVPDDKTIGPGETTNFKLLVRDRQGNAVQLPANARVKWASSANHGTLGPWGGNQDNVDYTSKSTFSVPPPRVDDIKATVENLSFTENRQTTWELGIPPTLVTNVEHIQHNDQAGEAKGFVTVHVDYQVQLQPASNQIKAGGTQQLDVVLTPAYDGPGLAYKYTRSGNQGMLDVTNGAHSSQKTVTFTAKDFATGGTDDITVDVVSWVGGTELETLGSSQASVEVDPWRTAYFIVTQSFPSEMSTFTAATLRIPKVTGASTYIVEGTVLGAPYNKTFGGATSTNQYSVGEVLDGGSYFYINLAAGFNTIPSAAQARFALYQSQYGSATGRYKVTQ